MPAHKLIRMLLAVAVVVMGGAVFAMSELQRATDASSFAEYTSVRDLREATLTMAIAFNEASEHGIDASDEIETAERAVALTIARVKAHVHRRDTSQRGLIKVQIAAASRLAELTNQAQTSAQHAQPGLRESRAPEVPKDAQPEIRRDELVDRFLVANDKLLTALAGERAEDRRDAAWRPVMLVVALFLVLILLHMLLVERPEIRLRRRRRAQGEFVEAMQVARSEAEAYDVLSHHVERVSGASRVIVLNRNNSADRLEAVTPVEAGGPTAEGLQGAEPDSCLAIRMARTYHRAPAADPLLRCDVCGMNTGETTCVPSLVGGEVIGAVLVEHPRALSHERRRAIEQSVTEAAPVVANLRNLAVAELRAATDGLTGLANQRTVHETIKRAAAQAGRTASPFALILFDLDHFKAINDTYGHGKGDDILAAVGAVAAGTVRASDFVGRLGGEEFAIVLPDTNLAGALDVAEKLRAAIARISVPGVDRTTTASFGVAILPDDAGEPDLLLRVADRALYAAKNAGRDRVEAIRNTSPSPQPER